jgi:hypothetical protein
MTLEIAEDGEPLGLPYWLEITIPVATVKVMRQQSIMCSVLRTHLIKPSIQRTVSVHASHATARKEAEIKRLF